MILSRLSTAFLLLAVLGLALPGCTLLPEQKDKTKNWSAQRFYSEASAALRNKDYEEAIEYYEKLEARYPFGQYTMQAKLDLAYAYYKDEQNEAALETCDRFIQLHPTSPYVAYAYYLKGVVNFNRPVSFLERFVPTDTSQRDPGSAADAYRDFGEVVNRYPDSVYAKDARRRMVFLRNNLADSELHAARYYLDRGAYVAAANRAKTVVERYQRTPAVDDALEVMVEAYTELDMPDMAEDANRVLVLNRERGAFIEEDVSDNWLEDLWDFLQLDK